MGSNEATFLSQLFMPHPSSNISIKGHLIKMQTIHTDRGRCVRQTLEGKNGPREALDKASPRCAFGDSHSCGAGAILRVLKRERESESLIQKDQALLKGLWVLFFFSVSVF